MQSSDAYGKMLAELYDLRSYRDEVVDDVKYYTDESFDKYKPSFSQLTLAQLQYLSNLDTMRKAAVKYATGQLKTENKKHTAALKEFIKMEVLDLSIRNERLALIDEITRAHSLLQDTEMKPHATTSFNYPNTLNTYTPYIDILKKESI